MELFSKINEVFDDLSFLSQQWAFRLITILINQWNDSKIEEFLQEISKLIAKFISKWNNNSSRSKQINGNGVKEMNYLTIIIQKVSLNNQLIQQIAEGSKELMKSISEFITSHIKEQQYEYFIETLLIFINKLSKFPPSVQNLIDANIPEVGLDYIFQGKQIKYDEMDVEELIHQLSSIQNVMKIIKNWYELSTKENDKRTIQDMVRNHGEMISISDQLLQKYSDHDDIAIIVVNIIIWFNSISKQL